MIKKYNIDYDKIKPKSKKIKQFTYKELFDASKNFITLTKKNNNFFSFIIF